MKRHAYAVLGTTEDGKREISCYFDSLNDAVQYLKRCENWKWNCYVYRVAYDLMKV